jgi:glycosyltransferase involved in cell wall biosynthesis
MKILHVLPYSDAAYGGPVATLCGLAAAQARAGDRVALATLQQADGLHSVVTALERNGVDVAVLGTGRGPLMHSSGTRAVGALVAAADIVHVHGVWEQLVTRALAAAAAADVPCIIRPCGMLTEWSMRRHAMRKRVAWSILVGRAARRATAVHFATQQECDETTLLPAHGQRSFIEPNGVDVTAFTGGDAAAFRELHRIRDGRVVLFLGRLHPGKGIEHLIPAFADATTNDTLVLAGPAGDAYRRQLESMVSAFGLHERVRFTGMLSDRQRRDALAAADVFALPSEHESFGNAALEALASGTKVMVSNRVPLAPTIEAYGCGVVCEPARASVAGALEAALTSIVDAASATACAARFDWPVVAARVRVRYEETIAGTLA